MLQLGADIRVGLAVEQNLNAVFFLVHDHSAALKAPALRGGTALFCLQLRDSGLDVADRLIIVAQEVAVIGLGGLPPVAGHGRFYPLSVLRREKGTTVQGNFCQQIRHRKFVYFILAESESVRGLKKGAGGKIAVCLRKGGVQILLVVLKPRKYPFRGILKSQKGKR